MKKLLSIILGIIILLLLWKGFEFYQSYNNLLNQVSKLKDGELAFNLERQKDSSTIASQGQLILSQSEALKLGLLENNDLYGKIQSQVKTKQIIEIDSVFVRYTPPNYVDTSGWAYKYEKGDKSQSTIDSVLANSVLVPKEYKVDEKWYKLSGKIEKEGVMIDSFKIFNETSVTIGNKKTGFLNLMRKPVVDIQNTNPYLRVTDMSNIIVKPNKSLLNNKLFYTGLGLVGGLILFKKVL